MTIKIKYDDFLKHGSNFSSKNILICDDGISFDTNKEGLIYLKKNNIKYKKLKGLDLKIIFKFKTGYIIGLCLFLCALILNNARINEIRFNGDYAINDEIKYYIEDNLKHLGPLSFLNCKLNDLNFEIRQKYNGYEWISIEKKGNALSVVITEVDQELINKKNKQAGNIIANKTGIVKYYTIFNGSHSLYYNQYVKPGDVLVLGNGDEARGLILGDVIEEKKIKVKKQIAEDTYSGKIDNYEIFTIFGFDFTFNKEEEFTRSLKNEDKKFDWGFISYKNIQSLEKCDIMTIYDYDDAFSYAKSLIVDEFNKQKQYEKEELLQIELYKKSEDQDYYYFEFLVKKLVNLGQFIKE